LNRGQGLLNTWLSMKQKPLLIRVS